MTNQIHQESQTIFPQQYFLHFRTCCQGKFDLATKGRNHESAFKDLSYQPNIKALSQLEAEIQTKLFLWHFYTYGYWGNPSLATKSYGFQNALTDLSYEQNTKAKSHLKAVIHPVACSVFAFLLSWLLGKLSITFLHSWLLGKLFPSSQTILAWCLVHMEAIWELFPGNHKCKKVKIQEMAVLSLFFTSKWHFKLQYDVPDDILAKHSKSVSLATTLATGYISASNWARDLMFGSHENYLRVLQSPYDLVARKAFP